MVYCEIFENPDATQEHFEYVKAHVRASGPLPAEGQRLLIAGPADAGWRDMAAEISRNWLREARD